MGIAKPYTQRRSIAEIEKAIAANKHLLSLYNSPFPDGVERAKRKELKQHIDLLRYELKSRKGVES